MTGSRPASPPTAVTSVADFFDVEDIEAAGAARIKEHGTVVDAIAVRQRGPGGEQRNITYLAMLWARLT